MSDKQLAGAFLLIIVFAIIIVMMVSTVGFKAAMSIIGLSVIATAMITAGVVLMGG